jgi:hypothetical protein
VAWGGGVLILLGLRVYWWYQRRRSESGLSTSA